MKRKIAMGQEIDDDGDSSTVTFDVEDLRIRFFAKVNYESVDAFDVALRALVKEIATRGDNAENVSIEIVLNSVGGSSSQGLAVHDLICACDNDITTIALGGVSSASVPIFLAGSNRIIYPNTSFNIHESRFEDPEGLFYARDLIRDGKQLEAFNKIMSSIFTTIYDVRRKD